MIYIFLLDRVLVGKHWANLSGGQRQGEIKSGGHEDSCHGLKCGRRKKKCHDEKCHGEKSYRKKKYVGKLMERICHG